MVGFNKELGRGHLTAGGTVANCEAMWCARNVKFLPFAMQDAVKEVPELVGAQGMSIDLPGGGTKKLVEATTWDLLNLNTDVIVEMPDKVKSCRLLCQKGLSFFHSANEQGYEDWERNAFWSPTYPKDLSLW